MIVFLFFYKRSATHRHLHSSPTRRSSDLRVGHQRRHPPLRGVLSRHAGARRQPASKERDRKSTRLNSSHRCTSYAVFCLKKKKKCCMTTVSVNLAETTNSDPGKLPNHARG